MSTKRLLKNDVGKAELIPQPILFQREGGLSEERISPPLPKKEIQGEFDGKTFSILS